jgi:hypothetical protein
MGLALLYLVAAELVRPTDTVTAASPKPRYTA